MIDEKKVRDRMKVFLQEYDMIFVAGDKLSVGNLFFEKLSEMPAKNILLLVSEENKDAVCACEKICECGKICACGKIYACGNRNIIISQEEYRYLKELYYMYEFSDRIYMLEADDRYAGLGNYVSGGILTEEEMLAALLGEK